MADTRILVVSDIHYAGPVEQSREGYEVASVENRLGRTALKLFRDHIWLREPTRQNHLLDRFISSAGEAKFVVANGDYSCNTGFVGLSDDAAFDSARCCLNILRKKYGTCFQATIGDHELGKRSLAGNCGGLRIESLRRILQSQLLDPFWTIRTGDHLLIGVTSTLLALPLYEPETLTDEWGDWNAYRDDHLDRIRETFCRLNPRDRLVLFCHDPSALPFLLAEPKIEARLSQVEMTIVGHLHSPLIFSLSRLLSGIPPIRCLGNSIRRFSTALRSGKQWRRFNVRLCPSLAGIELLKDGGYLELRLPVNRKIETRCILHRIRR